MEEDEDGKSVNLDWSRQGIYFKYFTVIVVNVIKDGADTKSEGPIKKGKTPSIPVQSMR